LQLHRRDEPTDARHIPTLVRASPTELRRPRAWLDRLGIGASTLCAVHCVVLALLAGGLPAGAEWVGEAMDLPMTGGAIAIAGLALAPGYRRHRWPMPVALAAFGAAALLGSRMPGLSDEVELGASLVGALSFVVAHLANLRAHRSCVHGVAPVGAETTRCGRPGV
jgi:hypothetical protein